ncbi:MAG: flagellar basal body P-ring formation chaperone FlgA [Proteobacteria bacterium]|jgi:flagella basal body P-ring formation protein FlgA|nr:flagellar basal body P-ring formation chaperone FlgA [Pseudomonadota bacterium]
MVKALVLATFLFSMTAQAEKLDVQIKSQATVRTGEPIRLGEISDLTDFQKPLVQKLYDLVIYDSILNETTVPIEAKSLAQEIRGKLSFQDLQQVSLRIPEVVQIKAKRNFISENGLRRQIYEEVERYCGSCEVVYTDLKIPEIQGSSEVLGVQLDTQSVRQPGSFLLPLIVETSQGKQQLFVQGRMQWWKEAPIAKRMIQFGQRIQMSDLELKKINIGFVKDATPQLQDLVGRVSARTITIGQNVSFQDLKKEAAVERGQTVKLLIGSDVMEITSSAVAEETGFLGDVIRVKQPETKKVISGVLVEKGVVKVQ